MAMRNIQKARYAKQAFETSGFEVVFDGAHL